jgi:hypothetical protein
MGNTNGLRRIVLRGVGFEYGGVDQTTESSVSVSGAIEDGGKCSRRQWNI